MFPEKELLRGYMMYHDTVVILYYYVNQYCILPMPNLLHHIPFQNWIKMKSKDIHVTEMKCMEMHRVGKVV